MALDVEAAKAENSCFLRVEVQEQIQILFQRLHQAFPGREEPCS